SVFTLAVCLRVRMVAWYGPIWMLVVAPHLKSVFDQLAEFTFRKPYQKYRDWAYQRSFRIFMFSASALWLAFAFSPSSLFVLGGKPRPEDRLYHKQTPLGVANYLRENPPEGRIANPQWWGDWLVWDGPSNLQVFMTTNAVHVVPAKVWNDYLAIANSYAGWESRLVKYRINTIVIHKEKQAPLHRAIRGSLEWKTVYEDELGLVAVRTEVPESH
ncbi:MAG: hypothetical protein KDA84_03445, partial [Planctomycetaceae bacterium]|nr:hypothetical protein [Planctomycetaceae bacterium]